MLNSTYTWSHTRGNAVVPSRSQATEGVASLHINAVSVSETGPDLISSNSSTAHAYGAAGTRVCNVDQSMGKCRSRRCQRRGVPVPSPP